VFEEFGAIFVSILRSFGVEASLGSVTGEYCPGEYSINARGAVKLVGTAQRVRRGARLFSACVPYSISASVAFLFERINEMLGLQWRPETLSGLDQEAAGLSIAGLEQTLIESFSAQTDELASLTDIYRQSRELVLHA
jgi:lipoate-protein ligase A